MIEKSITKTNPFKKHIHNQYLERHMFVIKIPMHTKTTIEIHKVRLVDTTVLIEAFMQLICQQLQM